MCCFLVFFVVCFSLFVFRFFSLVLVSLLSSIALRWEIAIPFAMHSIISVKWIGAPLPFLHRTMTQQNGHTRPDCPKRRALFLQMGSLFHNDVIFENGDHLASRFVTGARVSPLWSRELSISWKKKDGALASYNCTNFVLFTSLLAWRLRLPPRSPIDREFGEESKPNIHLSVSRLISCN